MQNQEKELVKVLEREILKMSNYNTNLEEYLRDWLLLETKKQGRIIDYLVQEFPCNPGQVVRFVQKSLKHRKCDYFKNRKFGILEKSIHDIEKVREEEALALTSSNSAHKADFFQNCLASSVNSFLSSHLSLTDGDRQFLIERTFGTMKNSAKYESKNKIRNEAVRKSRIWKKYSKFCRDSGHFDEYLEMS